MRDVQCSKKKKYLFHEPLRSCLVLFLHPLLTAIKRPKFLTRYRHRNLATSRVDIAVRGMKMGCSAPRLLWLPFSNPEYQDHFFLQNASQTISFSNLLSTGHFFVSRVSGSPSHPKMEAPAIVVQSDEAPCPLPEDSNPTDKVGCGSPRRCRPFSPFFGAWVKEKHKHFRCKPFVYIQTGAYTPKCPSNALKFLKCFPRGTSPSNPLQFRPMLFSQIYLMHAALRLFAALPLRRRYTP